MDNDAHVDTLFKENTLSSKPELDIKRGLLIRRESLTKGLRELNSVISRTQEEYTKKLEGLQAKKKPLEEALQHVEALLQFEGYYFDDSRTDVSANITVQANTKSTATDAAFELLTELHQPLHYKEIALKLHKRSIYIPGKEPAATLLSRINRDSRFKRTKKRGVYALSSWRIRDIKRRRSKSRKARKP